METWLKMAERCKTNYEYAERELIILRQKVDKSDRDIKRIGILEQIYYEQIYQYRQCLLMAKKQNKYTKYHKGVERYDKSTDTANLWYGCSSRYT